MESFLLFNGGCDNINTREFGDAGVLFWRVRGRGLRDVEREKYFVRFV